MFTILDSQVICKQPGRYIGWPTVAKGPGGALYAVFSGDRDCHVCPFGKVFLIKSDDQGASWSTPTLIANTPLDDRDAGVCVCPDGTVVVSWFTSHFADYRFQFDLYHKGRNGGPEARWPVWDSHLATISAATLARWAPSYETPDHPDYLKRWTGFWTVRSRDGGQTWDEPALSPVYAPHGPAVLENGDLFFVGMRHRDSLQGKHSVGAARSRDQGKTWELVAAIPGFPACDGGKEGSSRLAEPHVVEAASGKLIAMARFEQTRDPDTPRRPSRLWQFDSLDGGRTWTEPRETVIVGKPPHLSRLRNGVILVSYGYRHAPYGQRASFSTDEGRTWQYSREIVFRDDSGGHDLGYASSVECREGTLATLYYQIDRKGEPPSLMMTRTRLNETAEQNQKP